MQRNLYIRDMFHICISLLFVILTSIAIVGHLMYKDCHHLSMFIYKYGRTDIYTHGRTDIYRLRPDIIRCPYNRKGKQACIKLHYENIIPVSGLSIFSFVRYT